MVAGSTAFFLDGGSVADLLPAGVSMHNKCRYKTGKCSNVRSSKRNGQPHQLCLYHRDKANKIQRKFDRQKRQSVRTRKASGDVTSSASSSGRSSVASTPSPSYVMVDGPAAAFAALSAQDVEIYSDSDSSRFSTDSTDSESSVLDQVWADLPETTLLIDLASDPVVSSSSSMPMSCGMMDHSRHAMDSGALSHEEIDFLYSAMLE